MISNNSQFNTNNGFLPSRVTTDERNSFILPSMGLLIFNLTTNTLQVNIGSSQLYDWRDIITGTATGTPQNLSGGTLSGCFLLSRVDTTTRNDFINPAKGLMIYNRTTNTIQINLGTETTPDWKDLITNTTATNLTYVITQENPNNGFDLPQLTTAQRNAIANPMVGSIFFNTTTRTFQANLGTNTAPSWVNFSVSENEIPQKTDVLGYSKAAHLLRRATYKITKSMINDYATKTPQQALNDLFVFTAPVTTRPLNNLGQTYIPTVAEPTITDTLNTAVNTPPSWEKLWLINNAINASTIQYKIINLLHVFFIVNDFDPVWRVFDYMELLRFHSNGSLKDLAIRMTRDARMSTYLDNRLNSRTSPNQNYAREFLELFTILKGDQISELNYTNYTETDVQQAARVLTGFTSSAITNDLRTRINIVDPVTQIPRGIISVTHHDTGNKTFSSAFGNTVITGGTTEETIQQELVNFVNMVFNRPATALNYCRRIYRFFAGRATTPVIERTVIVPMAVTLMNNNYNIVPVIKELLCSKHFYDENDTISGDQNIGALLKSPLDLLLQMYSIFQLSMPAYATSPESIHSFMSVRVLATSTNASFPFYRPVSVEGYTGYSDAPNYDKKWITTGTLRIRYVNTIDAIISGFVHNGFTFRLDTVLFVRNSGNFSNPANANTLLQEFYDLLFVAIPQADRHTFFRDSLLGALSVINWQNEWNLYISTNNSTAVKIALDRLVRALVKSPEYQIM